MHNYFCSEVASITFNTILSFLLNDFINEPEFMIVKIPYPKHDSNLFVSIYRRPEGLLFNTFIDEFCKHYPNLKNVSSLVI